MSGTEGTRVDQLGAATSLTNTDALLVVQSVSGVPTARLASVARLRSTILGNTTEAFLVAANSSSASNTTAGLTLKIGGTDRGQIYGARIGTSNEVQLAFAATDTGNVLTQYLVLSKTAATFSGLLSCIAEPSSGTALVMRGCQTDNIAALRFQNYDSSNSYSLFASTAGGFAIANNAGQTVFRLAPTSHNLELVSATVLANPTSPLMLSPKQYVDSIPSTKIIGSSADWSGSSALSTTPLTIIDISFPGNVAVCFVGASSLGAQGSTSVNSVILEVQVLNASGTVVSTSALGLDAGTSGNGNYSNATGMRALNIAASTTAWKLRFTAKAGGSATPLTLTDMSASALFVLR